MTKVLTVSFFMKVRSDFRLCRGGGSMTSANLCTETDDYRIAF